MSRERERQPRFSFGVDPDSRPTRPGQRARSRRVVMLAGLLVLLLGAGAYLYVYQPHSVRRLLGDSPLAPSAVTRAYKWQDAEGGWHITGERPPAGVPYEALTVRSDTNILPSAPPKN